MPGTVTITISGKAPDFTVSPSGTIQVPYGDSVRIIPPSGGCTICFYPDVDGKASYNLTNAVTIPFSEFEAGSSIQFDLVTLNGTCPTRATRDHTHTIQIGSSK